jgi:hypothetical protein
MAVTYRTHPSGAVAWTSGVSPAGKEIVQCGVSRSLVTRADLALLHRR